MCGDGRPRLSTERSSVLLLAAKPPMQKSPDSSRKAAKEGSPEPALSEAEEA